MKKVRKKTLLPDETADRSVVIGYVELKDLYAKSANYWWVHGKRGI